jgi:hypothetical protein
MGAAAEKVKSTVKAYWDQTVPTDGRNLNIMFLSYPGNLYMIMDCP